MYNKDYNSQKEIKNTQYEIEVCNNKNYEFI